MRIRKTYFGLIGLLILAFILYSIDLGKVLEVLLKIEPFYLLTAIILGLFSILLKGLKYKVVVRAHNKSISFLDGTKYFMIGFFLSLITPGRIGEIARALYANQKINSIGKSISTVVFDRAIDLALLIAMGFVATLSFSLSVQTEVIPIELLAVVAIGFVLALFLISRRNIVRVFLTPLFKAIVPERFKQQARTGFEEFYKAMGEATKNKADLAIAVAIGIFTWTVVGFSIFFYLLALNLNIPLHFVFLLFPAMTLVEILPISFSGLGTREATVIFLLGFYGITAPEAVAFSMLVFMVGYVLNSLMGFVLFTRESSKIDFDMLR